MVSKAVILAAGQGTRFLPYTKASPKEMIAVFDKPALQIIVEEVIAAGITDILIIINSAKASIQRHFSPDKQLEQFLLSHDKPALAQLVQQIGSMANISYAFQEVARGTGDALLLAQQFADGQPVAVLNGDDAFYNDGDSATKQVVQCYNRHQRSVIGVQKVTPQQISKYGAICPISATSREILINDIKEKPVAEQAPSLYAAMGRYVISADFFQLIQQTPIYNNELRFTDTLTLQARQQPIYAYDIEGIRYDLGDKLGYLQATMEYALRSDLGQGAAQLIKQLASKL